MYSYVLIGIIIAWFIVIIGFLSWNIISARGPWYTKFSLVLVTMLFISSNLYFWTVFQGTPATRTDLNGLLVKSFIVKEPRLADPGKIWIWVIDPDHWIQEPLNISVPYSKKLHQELSENESLKKGRPQRMVKRSRGLGNDDHEYPYGLEDINPLPQKDN
jgi:hypothetical protein